LIRANFETSGDEILRRAQDGKKNEYRSIKSHTLRSNTDGILATIERLYAMALEDHPGSDEFLGRMAWLPMHGHLSVGNGSALRVLAMRSFPSASLRTGAALRMTEWMPSWFHLNHHAPG